MDLFEVIISPKALSQLNEYVDYIQFTLLNEQAARNVWQDAIDTADKLETTAGALSFCRKTSLKKQGYRIINFLHHRYVMLYRIEDKTVYVEAVYHQLQDYENIFSNEQ
ncbi:MAG: type II toxin-antitoxin system RelE/ParE family toxin [Parasporobacterium sp.]|nr:type II toxin-antitoxin system RelE/ParE family toxin [Parasporobacterium sp.]